jgi:hypothetical protein
MGRGNGKALFGAKTFAVTDVSPIGAARNRSTSPRRVSHSGKTLKQAALRAEMHDNATAASERLIDGFKP